MGILSSLEPQHRLALPHTPPELVSLGGASSGSLSSSSGRCEDSPSWHPVPPISPPMSNYDQQSSSDMSTGKSVEDPPSARRDAGPPPAAAAAPGAAAPRQQLPSLSSLFGPQPPVRPLHSPLSDRPSQYTSAPPLDRPPSGPAAAVAATTPLERSYSSSSYFPSTASSSLSQPRSSYETRFDDRSSYGTLPRTSYPAPPISPRNRDSDSRPDYGGGSASSASKWTTLPEAGRTEYGLGSSREHHHQQHQHHHHHHQQQHQQQQQQHQPPPYKSPHDRYPPPVVAAAGQKHEHDAGLYHRDQRAPGPPPPSTLPPTPSSTVTSEGIPAKDGLGPKIWTGTHFLPRFVRAAEVAGEGMCYFYDDGSHCKTVIDGEAVNAHWGVTKAGKPRKRLAIACVTCREKKIKCDPDYPRCVQCEKFGRVCRFKNAPRGGHNTSPGTPPAEPDLSRRMGPLIRPPPPESPRPGSTSSASVSPRTTFRPASPEGGLTVPHKRMRIGYEQYAPSASGQRSPLGPAPDTGRLGGVGVGVGGGPGGGMMGTAATVVGGGGGGGAPWQQQELPRLHEDVLVRAWQTDPYVSDPQSVTSTVASFFVHLDRTALRFLPERAFKSWIQNSAAAHHRKSPEDMMLVYSILALGVALSGGPRTIAFEYAQVGRFATERVARPCLQLVQARLVLSLFYLAVSRPSDAAEMASGATAAATLQQLNMELDSTTTTTTTTNQAGGSSSSSSSSSSVFPYNLTRLGYAETRRRTFWACFVLERLSSLFPLRPATIDPEDIFIRLPAATASFEDQIETAAPVFQPHFSSSLLQKQQLQQQQHESVGMGTTGFVVQIVAIWGDVMTCIYRMAHRSALYDFDFIKFHRGIMTRLEDWKASLPARLSAVIMDTGRWRREDDEVKENPGDDDEEEEGEEEAASMAIMHMVYHMVLIKLHRHIHPRLLTSALRGQYARTAQEHARHLLDLWCGMARSNSGGRRSETWHPFTTCVLLEAADVLTAEGAFADLGSLRDDLSLARTAMAAVGASWAEAQVHGMALDHRLDRIARILDRLRDGDHDASPGADFHVFYVRDDDAATTTTTDSRLPATGWCWQISDPIEVRFPRDMDTVYNNRTPLPQQQQQQQQAPF